MRKPVNAQTKQKISRALKNKKKKGTKLVNKALNRKRNTLTQGKRSIKNLKKHKASQRNKALGLAGAGVVGAGALALKLRKKKAPKENPYKGYETGPRKININ